MLSSDSDALYYYYPIFKFYGQALKSGDSFLWNPFIFSGFPTYLSQTGGFFDPINFFLFSVFPSVAAYHLRLFIDLFLTLVFSYLTGRALGLSRPASSLIGMGYLLAFHWRFLSNILIANTLFLMPFLFWTFLRAMNGLGYRRWLWAVLGGAGLGLALLSGYTQIVFYALFLMGIFGIYYAAVINRDGNLSKRFLTLFLVLLAISAVGIFFGLPQILPAMEYLPLSTREGGLKFAETTAKSINPGDGILFFFPDYLYFPYLSGGRQPLYVGAFWFLMSLAGIIFSKRRPVVLGIAILFGFSLAASLNGSPLFYVLQKLPVFEYFRFPYRWMYLGAFFLSVLGAYGFDSLRDFTDQKALRRVFFVTGAVVLGITFFIFFFNFIGDAAAGSVAAFLDNIFSKALYGNFGFSKDPAHYQGAVLRGLNGWREFVSLKDISFAVPFAVFVFSYVLFLAFLLRKLSWERFRAAGFLLSLLTFAGIFMVQWKNALPQEITERHGMFLKDIIPEKERGLYRTYPFLLDRAFQKAAPPQFKLSYDELMLLTELQFVSGRPNMHMFSGISSVDGYDPFVSKELRSALRKVGSIDGGEGGATEGSQEYWDTIGMMAGKYIISGSKLDSEDLRLLIEYTLSPSYPPFFVYENLKALPRFYFAKSVVESAGASLTDLINEGKTNFSERSYLDCGNCARDNFFGRAFLETLSLRNGLFQFRTDTDADRWLVISEQNLPGWQAEIDGKETTIARANGLYMAVFVPPGKHEIIFEYKGILGEAVILKKLGVIQDR